MRSLSRHLCTLLVVGVAAFGFVGGPRPAVAHGHDDDWRAPRTGLTGLARGMAFAQACDNALHEELFEYDNCLRYWLDQLGEADERATVGFWYAGRERALGAWRNGYPDAGRRVALYQAAYARAQRRHPVSEAALCRLADRDPFGSYAKPASDGEMQASLFNSANSAIGSPCSSTRPRH